jgi:hypothetical protein
MVAAIVLKLEVAVGSSTAWYRRWDPLGIVVGIKVGTAGRDSTRGIDPGFRIEDGKSLEMACLNLYPPRKAG